MIEKDKKIKYFVYTRKSSEAEERQALSIQSQKDKSKELFGNLDVLEVLEESRSAFIPYNRPEFKKMIEVIERGEAQGIIAWHPDRLSRNEIDAATITYMLRTGKIRDLKFGSYNFDNSPEGIWMLQMALSQSQYSSAKLGKDVRRGLEKKVKLGWLPGSAPEGYLNSKTENRGENYIKKDPERFDVLRKAWDLMLTGNYTPPRILDILNNEWGFRTRKTKRKGGKPLARSTLYEIFSNPFYAGLLPYKGEISEGKHSAMITLDEFDRVQILLGRKGKPRPKQHHFAYTAAIRCSECDSFFTAIEKTKFIKSTGELKKFPYYYCTRNQGILCSQRKYLTLEKLETQIEKELEKYTILPEFLNWALEVLNEKNDKEITDRSKIYEMQHKNLTETQTELDELTKMRYRQLIDDEAFLKESRGLKSKIEKQKEELRKTEGRAEQWLELTEKTFNFATYARKALLMAEGKEGLELKRQILLAIGNNPKIHNQVLTIEPNAWLVPIMRSYPALKSKYDSLEPNKTFANKKKRDQMESIRLEWRARPDLNRRSSP